MNIWEYCTVVGIAVHSARPKPFDPTEPAGEQWCDDTGQATSALLAATEANDDRALKLAEPLAEKYWSHLSRAHRLLRAIQQ